MQHSSSLLIPYRSLPYPWQHAYQKALLEFDDAKLPESIAMARGTIDARKQVLALEPHNAEWQALEDALSGLACLKQVAC